MPTTMEERSGGAVSLTSFNRYLRLGDFSLNKMRIAFMGTVWFVNDGLSGNLQKPAVEVSSRFPVNRQNHW